MPLGNVTAHLEGHSGPKIPAPFLFPFICLGTGVVFDALFSQSMATVFMLGISFSMTLLALACLGKEVVVSFLDNYTWAKLHPYFIMFALLPTLIFESAFALDAQHFQHYMGQILTLAGPAFVTAFVMMGWMMYLLMCLVGEPWWTLGYCMLYGAIVSATDPVAVVALLKSLGVPHHLKVLIEGESLLNDGAAIVFHSLFHTVLSYEVGRSDKIELGMEIGLRFIGVTLSVLLGNIYARVTCRFLASMLDSVRERAVIVVFVYASYVSAEMIRGSGVLCVVAYGIFLNKRRQYLSAEAYNDNKRMWGFLAYFANCVIFIMTGMLAARDMYEEDKKHIALGLVTYFFTVVSRACAVIIFVVLVLRRFGTYPPEFSPVLIWGGLRGSLALLLALQSKGDPVFQRLDPEERLYTTTLGFISTTVVLSNLVQGATSGLLTKKLGLSGMSGFQLERMKAVIGWVKGHIKDVIEEKKKDPHHTQVNWSYVEKRVKLHVSLEEEEAKLQDREDDPEEEAREAVQRCYEALLWQMWNSGILSVDVRALQKAINEATNKHGPLDVQRLYENLRPRPYLKFLGLFCLKYRSLFDGSRCKWFADKPQLSDAWQLVLGLISCAQGVLSVYIYVHSSSQSVNRLLLFTNTLIVSFLAVEPLFRLWSGRQHLRKIFVKRCIIWPWADSLLVAVYLALWGVYVVALINCNDEKDPKMLFMLDGARRVWCKHLRTVMLFGVVSLIKVPQVLFLFCRFIIYVEIATNLQMKDEESLEGLIALIYMTEVVKRRLDNGTLVEDAALKKKLSSECDTVKNDAEKKLAAVMRKEAGPPMMTTIKTRQMCRETLSNAIDVAKGWEEEGYLGEAEAEHLKIAFAVYQRKVRGLHKLTRKGVHEEEDEESLRAYTQHTAGRIKKTK